MYFSTKCLRLPPISTQNLNAKPIIERAIRKSDVNGATKLKLYSYNGIGKYLGVCQNFSVGVSGGPVAVHARDPYPPNVGPKLRVNYNYR